MSENKTICIRAPLALIDDMNELVQAKRYRNKSEVVVTGLRLLIQQEKQLASVRTY